MLRKKSIQLVALVLIFNPFTFLFGWMFPAKDLGVYKSYDAGDSWQKKSVISRSSSIANLDILTITIDPKESRIVYLGTRGAGLYKSQDGGEHWYRVSDAGQVLKNTANVYNIAIDPKDTSNVYLGIYQDRRGRFLRSTDGGNSFEETYVVSKDAYAIFAVEVDAYNPATIYIGTAQGGFLKSLDYGKSWQLVKWFDSVIADIKIDPRNNRIVYVSTFKKGIYKSYDKGATWISFLDKINKFKQANDLEQIIMDPERPNVLYVGSSYGLIKSSDGGENWEEIKVIIPTASLPVLSIAVDPNNSKILYYTAGSSIYKSVDGGVSWTISELPTSKNARYIAIDPADSDVIYVGMHK